MANNKREPTYLKISGADPPSHHEARGQKYGILFGC